MLNVYSLNVTVPIDATVPFNNTVTEKGCTAVLASPSTIQLNKRGVYMVSCYASSEAASTIQLYRDGVALPQTEVTGTSPSFTTLVQVKEDNCKCNCCSSPTNLSLVNAGDAAATFTTIGLVITKLC